MPLNRPVAVLPRSDMVTSPVTDPAFDLDPFITTEDSREDCQQAHDDGQYAYGICRNPSWESQEDLQAFIGALQDIPVNSSMQSPETSRQLMENPATISNAVDLAGGLIDWSQKSGLSPGLFSQL